MNKSYFENIKSTLTKSCKAGKFPTSNTFYNPITKPNKKFKSSVHYYYEGDNKAHQQNYTYLKEMEEQLEYHNAKKGHAVFKIKEDIKMKHRRILMKTKGWKVKIETSSIKWNR